MNAIFRRNWICLFLLLFTKVLFGCQLSPGSLEIQGSTVPNHQIPAIKEPKDGDKPYPRQTQEPENQLAILFIGNSYTFYNDLPRIFSQLMASGGYQVDVGQATQGGWSLSNHRNSSATTKVITNGEWDFVVLQEQSVVNNPELGMFPSVESLNELIRENDAETILFMTWGRKDGLPKSGYPNFASMQDQVTHNYLKIGTQLGLTVAPVGVAWVKAINLNPDLALWDLDGSHPSRSGTYLAACVFYTIFSGKSPDGLEYIANLPPETASLLQSIAAQTVIDDPNQWFLGKNQ